MYSFAAPRFMSP